MGGGKKGGNWGAGEVGSGRQRERSCSSGNTGEQEKERGGSASVLYPWDLSEELITQQCPAKPPPWKRRQGMNREGLSKRVRKEEKLKKRIIIIMEEGGVKEN